MIKRTCVLVAFGIAGVACGSASGDTATTTSDAVDAEPDVVVSELEPEPTEAPPATAETVATAETTTTTEAAATTEAATAPPDTISTVEQFIEALQTAAVPIGDTVLYTGV